MKERGRQGRETRVACQSRDAVFLAISYQMEFHFSQSMTGIMILHFPLSKRVVEVTDLLV